ncbi:vWA domain-containing protein [Thalassoroseus pseudoceratinae]|uniref:vWA domain-containing protein n=1 Tax=Thalassoroseus pseudoceratinae TaxID=2713176 RepID=UPI0014209AF4|nr:hypothetical protein [Thalassoroseus pseudoceratinae]
MPTHVSQKLGPSRETVRTQRAWMMGVWISAGVHLALFIILTLWWFQTDSDASFDLLPLTVLPSRVEPTPEFAQVVIPSEAEPSPTTDSLTGGGETGGPSSPVPIESAPQLPVDKPLIATEHPGSEELADHLAETIATSVQSEINRLFEAGGSGVGGGTGDGSGSGHGFFGMKQPGKSFVYVVDSSMSMNAPHESEWGTRFGRVQVELIRSIASLDSPQRFFVVFFNTQAMPMPTRGLLDAELSNRKKSLRWVATMRPAGETDPRQALALALRLQPDVIYFLTDGDFSIEIKKELIQLRQHRTSVHTYAFGTRDGSSILRQIARQNGGEFHFVP